eukprot:152829_1
MTLYKFVKTNTLAAMIAVFITVLIMWYTVNIDYKNQHLQEFGEDKMYQLSYHELNKSLFCPLKHKLDILKYSHIVNDIHKQQFEISCDITNLNNTQYYIMEDHSYSYGFFSTLDNNHIPFFLLSLFLNRTFVIKQNENYRYLPHFNGKNISECQGRIGRHCYFKYMSKCNHNDITNILQTAYQQKTVFIFTGELCNHLSSMNYSFEQFEEMTKQYSVIYNTMHYVRNCLFIKKGKSRHQLIKKLFKKKQYKNITYFEIYALAYSFILRLQSNIQSIIHKIVLNILNKYNWTHIYKTISLPIRSSDKCYVPFHRGEMRCTTQKQHIDAIYEFKKKFIVYDIDTVIITSESKNIIQIYRNLSENMTGIKFVFNDFDIMPSTGNPLKIKLYETDIQWFNMIISMISSLKLQMHANYYVTRTRSSWNNGIWVIASSMHCDLFSDMNDYMYEKQKHCINFDINAKKFDMDKYCFRNMYQQCKGGGWIQESCKVNSKQ